MEPRDHRSAPVGLWALALGAVGFVCGFFGPIALNPSANQGPLLGLFITGPGGALLGLVLGGVAAFLPLSARQRWLGLGGACGALALGVLFSSLPGPEYRGEIVDGEVRGCSLPSASVGAAVAAWEGRLAKTTWAEPRPGWKDDTTRMLQEDRGVVLDVDVHRTRAVFENRKPWNRGSVFARPWDETGASRRYFASYAGSDCKAYEELGRGLFFPTSEMGHGWPPDRLPNFLDLMVLGPVPDAYRPFAGS
jgi:hypothetical protein